MEQEQSAYITSLHLKGYKSIRDVSVTLNKGLNILIGANGSGKTNFLEFLDAAYRSDYEVLLNGQKLEYKIEGKPFSVKIKGDKILRKDLRGINYQIEKETRGDITTYYLNSDKKVIKTEKNGNPIDYEFDLSFDKPPSTVYSRFENPLTNLFKEKLAINLYVSQIDNVIQTLDGEYYERHEVFESKLKVSKEGRSFLNQIFNAEVFDKNESMTEIIEQILGSQLFSFDSLRQNLKQFSPIKDIKIDWFVTRQTIQKEENGESASIESIDFDFFVINEPKPLKWSQLSDGTKRLFYLIGSVTYAKENEIILIEEPELGVHPHQLALLMNFLKAESEDKQIIISTHSPQVLNCLKGEELDRIIVARHEGKAGTKLYHLSEEEKGYASEYMEKESFLSDYWLLSGFMDEQMAETL